MNPPASRAETGTASRSATWATAVNRRMAEKFGGDARRMRRAAGEGLALVASLIPDLARWPAADQAALARILRAKKGRDETAYLRLMQKHERFRSALLALK